MEIDGHLGIRTFHFGIFQLESLTRYRLIVNTNPVETLIIADVYCKSSNYCALYEIEKLHRKYNNQTNPFNELKKFIYADSSPKQLQCFDSSLNKNDKCSQTNNTNKPVCIAILANFTHKCSFDSDAYLYQEFIVTSPTIVQFELMNELVRCNTNNCNTIDTLVKIENISKNYTIGTAMKKNILYG